MLSMRSVLVLIFGLGVTNTALAQRVLRNQDALDAPYLHTSPKIMQLFRPIVSKPVDSTVRILCDDKDTALGMVVAEDGWILTKANDLSGKLSVKLKDGKTYPARNMGVNRVHDLAMLKIDASGLKPIEFADSKEASVGDWIACVGIGEDPVAIGVVSVAARNLSVKALPAVDLSKVAYLGVSLDKGEGGVLITKVEPASPGARAGLKLNDIVLSASDLKVKLPDELIEVVQKRKPGDILPLRVRRDDEELVIKATLGKRPTTGRSDQQNSMGSVLSSRTTGYPSILQHDSVVKPTDCGGPLVDLEGHVIGINICRAGRTESWAVPTETIRPLFPELMSGRLAPKETKEAAVDHIVALVRKRLEVVENVAKAKWTGSDGVADETREKAILAGMLEKGRELALNQDAVASFFQAQMEAARQLQKERFDTWKADKTVPFSDVPDLRTVLRPQLDDINLELIHALAECQPFLNDVYFHTYLSDRAQQNRQELGVSEGIWTSALRPLRKSS